METDCDCRTESLLSQTNKSIFEKEINDHSKTAAAFATAVLLIEMIKKREEKPR